MIRKAADRKKQKSIIRKGSGLYILLPAVCFAALCFYASGIEEDEEIIEEEIITDGEETIEEIIEEEVTEGSSFRREVPIIEEVTEADEEGGNVPAVAASAPESEDQADATSPTLTKKEPVMDNDLAAFMERRRQADDGGPLEDEVTEQTEQTEPMGNLPVEDEVRFCLLVLF